MRLPLNGRYWPNVLIVVLALSPNIVATTAYFLLRVSLQHGLGTGPRGLELVEGLSNGGYAFGALVGGDLVQRFPQRRLYIIFQAMFVVGAVLAAVAPGIVVFGAGRNLMGLATGVLLVAAIPPLVREYPTRRLAPTATAINVAFFGAVCAGPLIGGAVAQAGAWRWFFGGLAGLGALALIGGTLSFPLRPGTDPGRKIDAWAIALAAGATILTFYGVSKLTGVGFSSLYFVLPFAIGLLSLAGLLVLEYHRHEPVSPVKPISSTVPVVGALIASFGGAAFITLLELTVQFLLKVRGDSPVAAGLVFWPELAGAVVMALLLGMLIGSRWLIAQVFGGMLLLIGAGAALVTLTTHTSHAVLLVAAALLGLGAGATVSPGLWIAAFALPSALVGQTFALVELLRSVADYCISPVMLKVAKTHGGAGAAAVTGGLTLAVWITLGITALATLIGAYIWLSGRAGLPRIDLGDWLSGERPGLGSPRLAEAHRAG